MSPAGEDAASDLRFFQVAVSVQDRRRALSWYTQVLGVRYSGELTPDDIPEGADPAAVMGSPKACSMTWAVDAQSFFQLEIFAFDPPHVRVSPRWRACDVGYAFVTYWVSDLDGVLRRAGELGHEPLTAPVGAPGSRHVCLRDPDGIMVELVESDRRTSWPDPRPRPELGVAARGVRLSVPDLSRARRFFVDGLGMTPTDDALHGQEHEAIWGLPGATRTIETLTSGDMWLGLAQYQDPPGAPRRPGYDISDHGIFNVALGTRSRETYRRAVDAIRATPGHWAGQEVLTDVLHAAYVANEDGFSVEICFVDESADRDLGLLPVIDA